MTTIVRRIDWPGRLIDSVKEHMYAPFAWGSNDVVTFAADTIAYTNGFDFLSGVRGTYSTEDGCVDAFAAHGGLQAFMDARFERQQGHPFRGDLCLVKTSSLKIASVAVVFFPYAYAPHPVPLVRGAGRARRYLARYLVKDAEVVWRNPLPVPWGWGWGPWGFVPWWATPLDEHNPWPPRPS